MGRKVLVGSTASAVTVSAGSIVAFPASGQNMFDNRDVENLGDIRVAGEFSASQNFEVRTAAKFEDHTGSVYDGPLSAKQPTDAAVGPTEDNEVAFIFDGPHVHVDEWVTIKNTSAADMTVEQLAVVWSSG